MEKRCLVPASLGVFLMLVSLDVPLNITNSLFPTVDNFVARCAAEAVFVVLHWNNTRPRLRPCMVEVDVTKCVHVPHVRIVSRFDCLEYADIIGV